MDYIDSLVPDLEDVIAEQQSIDAGWTSDHSVGACSLEVNSVSVDTVNSETEAVESGAFNLPATSGWDDSTFDRALLEPHISNSHAALPKFCWEESIFGDIFGNDSTGIPNMLNVTLQPPGFDSASSASGVAVPNVGTLKRKSDDSHYVAAVKVII